MAQLDVQQTREGLGWIGFVVVSILTLLGGGTLFTVLGKAIWDRYWGTRDKQEEKQEATDAAQIASDDQFRSLLIKRIEKLEADLKEMQKEQLSQARSNERLQAENEHLKEDKNRQEGEITDLKNRNRALNDKVIELTQLVHKLEIRISELTGQPIDVRLVNTDPEQQ